MADLEPAPPVSNVDEKHDDTADKLQHASELFTEEQSRKIARKMDFNVLPIMWLLFTIQFMDKQALNYGAIWGLKKDLNLDNNEFKWLGSIFYFGYLAAQFIFPPLVHRLPISRALSAVILLWSTILMCMPACKDFTGIAIQRFFLGLTEGGVTPCFVILTSLYYTRKEQSFRSAVWLTGNAFGNIFGSLLGYAFGAGHLAIAKWKLFPLVFGAISLLFSGIVWFFVPNHPGEARFLNDEEKRIALLRIRANETGLTSKRFDINQVKEALIDPKTYFVLLLGFVNNLQASGPGIFGSQIVKGFGFDELQATALQGIPTGSFQAICVLLAGYLATRYQNLRLILIAVFNLPCIIGGACLYSIPKSHKALLAAYVLVYSGPASMSLYLAVVSANFSGYTKKSVAATMVILGYSVGQIAGPQFFTKSPYKLGFGMMMACYALTVVLALGMRVYMSWENKRRDRLHLGEVVSEAVADEQDLTDWQRKATFRYVL